MDDLPKFLQSESPGKERLKAASEDRKELEEQIIGLNRMVAWLLLEQGKTSVEIPAWIMLELDDSWELVSWTNKMTEGRVIELRGTPDSD